MVLVVKSFLILLRRFLDHVCFDFGFCNFLVESYVQVSLMYLYSHMLSIWSFNLMPIHCNYIFYKYLYCNTLYDFYEFLKHPHTYWILKSTSTFLTSLTTYLHISSPIHKLESGTQKWEATNNKASGPFR
jgi:hypothetical protein